MIETYPMDRKPTPEALLYTAINKDDPRQFMRYVPRTRIGSNVLAVKIIDRQAIRITKEVIEEVDPILGGTTLQIYNLSGAMIRYIKQKIGEGKLESLIPFFKQGIVDAPSLFAEVHTDRDVEAFLAEIDPSGDMLEDLHRYRSYQRMTL